jgi:hypothetical protein
VFRRTSTLLILAVDKADVHGLPYEIEQVFSGKINKSRAQKNVIMDVVDAEGEI